ncbi:protein of unassigned function [Methylobacterium oryzae CBMB20]|uniref:Protein of unassigned function n=1 Tax=Methylobacterium oryzae CBMB20 TaxID=693986 RepID=A0A089P1W6_9HYPH|nr:protein of unassigned function [Methylobacterium oryzae CBMB20]
MGVYTSSKVGKFGDALPIGVIQVGREQASRLGGQVAFFIDVRKRASALHS